MAIDKCTSNSVVFQQLYFRPFVNLDKTSPLHHGVVKFKDVYVKSQAFISEPG